MIWLLTKEKFLADQLDAAVQPIIDSDMVLYILASLDFKYELLVVSITIRPEPISLNDLYGLLLTHEHQLA